MGKRMTAGGRWMAWGMVVFLGGACNSLLGTDAIKTDGCPHVGARDCADASTPKVCAANGTWENQSPCFQQTCRAGECVGECAFGLWRCAALAPQVCDENGQWKNDGPVCDNLCFEGTCLGDCVPGDKRCNGDTPQTCNGDGHWKSADSPCIDQVCNPLTGTCSGSCKPGQATCVANNQYKFCDANGLVQYEPCGLEKTCDPQKGCIGICSPGQKNCNGNAVEVCNGGQWQFEAFCPGQTCSEGVCVGVCEPGTRCAGDTVQSCDGLGQWQNVEVCSLPLYCAGGACIEACVAGDLRCQGNESNVCVDGVWQKKQACTGQTCVMTTGSCAGVCTPSDARCMGQTPEACDVNGSWKTLPACTGVCSSGSCPGPSCAGLPETCGPNKDENCCASRIVPATSYQRGDDVAFPATVSEFRLDRFEATVARFRKFYEAYSGPTLAEGAGAHPQIAGSGWKAAWNQKLPANATALNFGLQCNPGDHTFTSAPGPNDALSINCVNWYVAFAFCIWDGGRLPTEAEWHAAASGGSEQRRFPWSNPPESTKIDGSFAVYDCTGDGSPASVCSFFDNRPSGSRSPRGDGKFGHADLAGSMWEWALDAFVSTYPTPCIDCAFLGNETTRVLRGGAFSSPSSSLRSITRNSSAPITSPVSTLGTYGVRCARMP